MLRDSMEQRTLGDYCLIKPLGQGPLGSVYLAEHRFMKRQYVLKILPEELASDRGFIQRFEEEVGALASLDHPHIVKIYNISFAQGLYFIVMDCIVDELGETTNLAKYAISLRRSFEEEEIYSILHQIARALDYAHAKKVGGKECVHQSLKPNNILIGKRSQDGFNVYLSDFGLARIISPGALLTRTYKNVAEAMGIGQQLMQKSGQDRYFNPPLEPQKLIPLHTSFLQNYAFLAPEQKRIDLNHASDSKVDIYSFGVLAYFLLMNELPEGIFEMPSARKSFRYQWDDLVASCLQLHPVNRPENLTSLLESIRAEKPAPIIPEADLNINNEPTQSVEEKVHTEMALKYAVRTEEVTKHREKVEKEEFAYEVVSQKELFEEPVKKVKIVAFAKEEVTEVEQPQIVSSGQYRPSLQVSKLERPQTDLDPGAALQVSPSVKTYNPEPRDVSDVKPLLTDMIVVPGGTFYRGSQDGSRDEMPRHQVVVPSFSIDIHPVTNEQFVRFLEVMGGEKDSNHNDIIRLRDSRIKRSGGKLNIESGYSKHPVVGVTWYGAVAYAKWIGKRLPTEAEWEIAARGMKQCALYPTGEDIEKSQANFFSSDTTAVMSYAPSEDGLYDMAGNVYEWCYDWYGYNYYEISNQEPDNPQGPVQGVYRVLRGGCWKSLKEDLRCSRRHRNNPGTVNGTYGFRCVAGVSNSL